MDKEQAESFCKTLDEHHDWPCTFVFKFIVPFEDMNKILNIFDESCVSTRPSKTGKYVSVTAEPVMESSKAVLDVYDRASKVKGVISL